MSGHLLNPGSGVGCEQQTLFRSGDVPNATLKPPDAPLVKDQYGLEAKFVVVGTEQTQLLLAANSIKGVVDIRHDLPGRAFEGIAVNTAPLAPS